MNQFEFGHPANADVCTSGSSNKHLSAQPLSSTGVDTEGIDLISRIRKASWGQMVDRSNVKLHITYLN